MTIFYNDFTMFGSTPYKIEIVKKESIFYIKCILKKVVAKWRPYKRYYMAKERPTFNCDLTELLFFDEFTKDNIILNIKEMYLAHCKNNITIFLEIEKNKKHFNSLKLENAK